jgi:hypothetical protein
MKIDIFLDIDEVLQGVIYYNGHMRRAVFAGSVQRLNDFIVEQQRLSRDVKIVPVAGQREEMDSQTLRDLFERLGLMPGLPFVFFHDRDRESVVKRRLEMGASDAFVIFDDSEMLYQKYQPHLIVVQRHTLKYVPDDARGITPANIDAARTNINKQVHAKLFAATPRMRYAALPCAVSPSLGNFSAGNFSTHTSALPVVKRPLGISRTMNDEWRAKLLV